MSDEQRREVEGWQGLYVGQLDNDEIKLFETAVREGIAFRNYDHAGGSLGLAKVGLHP